jgi:hypothetical protein
VRLIVRNLLLLLGRRGTLDLLDVGRLMRRGSLGLGWVRRRVVALSRTLGRRRLMGRVGVRLVVVVLDDTRPRVAGVVRMVVWRWQALRRVGVMLESETRSATQPGQTKSSKKEEGCRKRTIGAGYNNGEG